MDIATVRTNDKGQAVPTGTAALTADAFGPQDVTTISWLGGAGFLLNARGTCIMVDPVLEGFDMPVVFDAPIAPADVPELDAILITHIDNDHFSSVPPAMMLLAYARHTMLLSTLRALRARSACRASATTSTRASRSGT